MDKVAELVDAARRIAVPGYEGIYEIDSSGLVHNLKRDREIYRDLTNKHGYARVNLFGPEGRKRRFVHRMVAEAFHPDTYDESLVVDHISGDKTNNHYKNLEVITQSENTLRAIALGLRTYKRKEQP